MTTKKHMRAGETHQAHDREKRVPPGDQGKAEVQGTELERAFLEVA